MTDFLGLDFETFGAVSLSDVGSSRYARDPDTEVLMLGFALNDEPVEVVRFAEGQKAPKWLKGALRDPEVKKSAWNSPFERQIFKHVLGLDIPICQWYDPMVLSYTLSFPGKLLDASRVAGLPADKQKDARGKALIRKFCGYRKPTKKEPWTRATHETNPEEWEEFVEYCRQDVETERAFRKKYRHWDMPEHEWALWYLDQEINEYGLPVNMRVVENAIKVADSVVASRIKAMKEITGLANPNSNVQLLKWLRENGYKYADLKAGHVKSSIADFINAGEDDPGAEEYHRDVVRVLGYRQEVSKSSVKKYNALAKAVDSDGRLRNTLQFAGAARTWRWGGRLYQPQNLSRPTKALKKMQDEAVLHLEKLTPRQIELLYDKPMDLLSTCVRPVVQAPKGFLLIDADLNAIENRVLGWLANDQKILDVFRKGRDPYVDFATYMYGIDYETLWHEYKVLSNDEKRTVAKPGVLGCGYMLSAGRYETDPRTGEQVATGLLGYAENMGIKLTPEQSELAVKTFRSTFEDVVQFWYDIEKAMRRCIVSGQPTRVSFLRFDMSGPFCRMHLPSGHALHYYKPRVEERRTPWGAMKPTITYEGSSERGRGGKGGWCRIPTHPGKITENAVQAIARDILGHGMKIAKNEHALRIFLHVHDQVVALSKEDEAEHELKILEESMSIVPKWAPGLILAAEGTVSRVFKKD